MKDDVRERLSSIENRIEVIADMVTSVSNRVAVVESRPVVKSCGCGDNEVTQLAKRLHAYANGYSKRQYGGLIGTYSWDSMSANFRDYYCEMARVALDKRCDC